MRLSQPKKIVFNICLTIAFVALCSFVLWIVVGMATNLWLGILSWALMTISFGLLTLSVAAKGI